MMRRVFSLVAIGSLGACSLAPPYQRPALPVPPSWPVGDAYLRQSEAALPSVTYRDVFRDPRLQRLIALAIANNRDLRVAIANIAAARAKYRIQRADLFPEIDATATYTHSYNGGGGAPVVTTTPGTGSSTGGTGTGTGTTTGTAVVAGRSGASNQYSLNASVPAWEIDLFGRVRSLTAAAQDRYLEQEAAARATRLTLVGDVASAWLTYASDKSLLRVAEETARSADMSVSLTAQRYQAGISPLTDLAQAREILHTARSDVASQTTQVAQDANALQLLVGAPVDPALLPASIEEAAPTIGELPAGLDSTVLLRRPDVVEAEYELRATNAEIGAARAELFPRVALTGMLGVASTALSRLFTGGAFNWSVSPGASYAIFHAGAARAQVRYSQAQRDAALATYEKTVQTAFEEVADALARRGTIDAQMREQRALVAASTQNYDLSDQRYRAGVDTYLNSLDAQRSLYSAQQTLIESELTKAANLVTLYETLGSDASLDPRTAR